MTKPIPFLIQLDLASTEALNIAKGHNIDFDDDVENVITSIDSVKILPNGQVQIKGRCKTIEDDEWY